MVLLKHLSAALQGISIKNANEKYRTEGCMKDPMWFLAL